MTLLDASTGLERIGREILLLLVDQLNDELDSVGAGWAALDQELAEATGHTYVPISLQHVAPENFYLGHRQSLIEAPVESFPNVSVMGETANPEPTQLDQADSYRDLVWIELMCNAVDEKDAGGDVILAAEDLVNRRTQRTAEAINNVVRKNLSLNGLVLPANTLPMLHVGDVIPRREKRGAGRTWWWQGARIEYNIDKTATY